MEKFLQNIEDTQRKIQTIDHLIYVTYPLVKDKHLLLKILLELKNTLSKIISTILQYEFVYKRINLYKNPKDNFNVFVNECASRYNISENQINIIREVFELTKKHNESPFEFTKNEKVVILSSDLKTELLPLEKTKEFLELSKDLFGKITKLRNST